MVSMNSNGKQKYLIVIAAALFAASPHLHGNPFAVFAGMAYAADQGSFGQKRGTATADKALKALKKHFEKKDIVIGEIIEKELYFEAEIKDQKNTVVDKVIIDKRTGRIRSIY